MSDDDADTIFEMKRMPFTPFRFTPRKQTIRERYETQTMLGLQVISESHRSRLMGKINVVMSRVTGLANAFWASSGPLHEVDWETREHIRGALHRLLADLNHIDRDDALKLVGRHEGHHRHSRGLSLHCSCDDDVILQYWTGILGPDYDPSKLSCTECGKQGVVLAPIPPKDDYA